MAGHVDHHAGGCEGLCLGRLRFLLRLDRDRRFSPANATHADGTWVALSALVLAWILTLAARSLNRSGRLLATRAALIAAPVAALAGTVFGKIDRDHDANLWNVSLYWHFLVLTVLVTAAVIGLAPRLL